MAKNVSNKQSFTNRSPARQMWGRNLTQAPTNKGHSGLEFRLQAVWCMCFFPCRLKAELRTVQGLVAPRLQLEPTMTLKWMADRLKMGTWTHVADRPYQLTK
jgi:hypothetical protein